MSLTNVEKFLAAIVAPFQAVENALQQLLIQRRIDNAIGDALTKIGKLVGRRREGVTDDDIYRRYVRAQVATNNSDGLVSDLILISTLVIGDDATEVIVTNWGTGEVTVRIGGVAITWPVANVLIELLRKGVSGGVKVQLEFSLLTPELTFSFEDGDGLGYDTFVPGGGGGYASIIE